MAPKLTAVALAALAFAAPAAAQTPIIDLAANSARGRSVYVHPDARLLTPAEARRLEREIEQQAQGPLYIAILPPAARDEVDGSASGTSSGPSTGTSRRGTWRPRRSRPTATKASPRCSRTSFGASASRAGPRRSRLHPKTNPAAAFPTGCLSSAAGF